MSLIVGDNVGRFYGERNVLVGATFALAPGDRVGLVGPNGEGKTTLLRLLAGFEDPTDGRVTRRAGLRIGYLPQDAPAPDGMTLWDSMCEVYGDLRRMEQELHDLADRLHEADERVTRRYDTLHAEFERQEGYAHEARIKAALTGLGFTEAQHHQPLAELSGGQRSRGMLARLLLDEPDVLLLDEPTNHLDLAATEWLERWLQNSSSAMVIVSHDRYFLDRATNRTWEISFGSLETYRGNYTAHLPQREIRLKDRMRRWERQQEYIRKTEEFVRRYHAAQRSKEARGRQKLLDRFLENEAIDKPRDHKTIRVNLRPESETGDFVLGLNGLAIGYDAPLFRMPDMDIRRGQCIAVVGVNGIGKTTLLKTLLGDVPPLEGSVRIGVNVQFGYLPQTHDILDPDHDLIEAVRAARPDMLPADVRTLLGSFLFSGNDVFKKIGRLSGGERSRVVLARLAARGANVLLLDEPTNHLDIPSQEVLQEMLRRFDGTVILVSHDRYLVQALATDIWVVDGSGFHQMKGAWDAFLRWRRGEEQAAASVPAQDGAAPKLGTQRKIESTRKHRVSKRLLNRQQKLEREVEAAEAELESLEHAINDASAEGNVAGVSTLGREYEGKRNRLQSLWDDLEAIVAEIEG